MDTKFYLFIDNEKILSSGALNDQEYFLTKKLLKEKYKNLEIYYCEDQEEYVKIREEFRSKK